MTRKEKIYILLKAYRLGIKKLDRDNHCSRTENDFYHETIKNINNTTKRRPDVQKATSYLLHVIHVDFSSDGLIPAPSQF